MEPPKKERGTWTLTLFYDVFSVLKSLPVFLRIFNDSLNLGCYDSSLSRILEGQILASRCEIRQPDDPIFHGLHCFAVLVIYFKACLSQEPLKDFIFLSGFLRPSLCFKVFVVI